MSGETIPWLELLGTLILAWLVNTVLAAFDGTLKVDSVRVRLDSQIALWSSVENSSNSFKTEWLRSVDLQSQLSGIIAPRDPIQLTSVRVGQWLRNWSPISCGGVALSFSEVRVSSGQVLKWTLLKWQVIIQILAENWRETVTTASNSIAVQFLWTLPLERRFWKSG